MARRPRRRAGHHDDGPRHALRARLHPRRRRRGRGTLITFGSVPPELLEGQGRAFYERYVARFGEEPECYAASAYDTTGVILQAIERVGRADRAAITEAAFATRDFDGVLGRWSFDANGDIDLRGGTRLTVRDGDFEALTVLPIDWLDEPQLRRHPLWAPGVRLQFGGPALRVEAVRGVSGRGRPVTSLESRLSFRQMSAEREERRGAPTGIAPHGRRRLIGVRPRPGRRRKTATPKLQSSPRPG